MYAFINGRLDSVKNDGVVVEAGGVGYLIFTAASVISRLPAAGSDVKLYTRFIVREDSQSLYGFLTRDELGMFDTLLAVQGVGPKAALALVSVMAPSQFGIAVLTEDHKLLTRAQGVGQKLAQKIVFELRGKMRKELGAFGADAGVSPALSAGVGAGGARGAAGGIADRGKFGEAVEALMVLGCSAAEANGAVSGVYKEDMPLEDIIRASLSKL